MALDCSANIFQHCGINMARDKFKPRKSRLNISHAYLRLMYEYLHSTVMVPLKLSVPPEWLVHFTISKDPDAYGWTNPDTDEDSASFNEYAVEVSKVKNVTHKDITETMLHEMIHIHLHFIDKDDWDKHDEVFNRVKRRIETYTGYDIS